MQTARESPRIASPSSTPDCHSRRCTPQDFANGCSTSMTSRDCMRRGCAHSPVRCRLRMSSACAERTGNTDGFSFNTSRSSMTTHTARAGMRRVRRHRRADGQYRWFLIQYKPVVDDDAHVACWYATGTDIEDRKRAENKLRQDERELRQLMDALPQHVLVLDKQGALLQANRTMLDYKGYTLEEMKGVGTRERINRDVHPDDLERVEGERR